MASTYTNDLRLELIATGEAAATWGDKTNANLTNIAAAFGYATQDGFAANADSTTTVADGAADPARAMYFKVTSSATLTATRTLTIAPNTISRVMWIENATTGGQSIQISQGTGANVTIPTGKTAVVYLDGAGSGAAVVDAMAGVSSGASDTLAEILAAGNATGGTDIAVSTGDDITFADNSKAIFGAGDLQIYHDGSHSYISDQGTGDLRILAADFRIRNAADNETMIQANSDADVSLWYNNSKKLATTNTGIDVTGTVTADGLTVDGQGKIQGSFALLDLVETDITDKNTRVITSGGQFRVDTVNDALSSSTKRIMVDHTTGDISFYEDTGTTAKLFWDASAESLGIGTSSPNAPLEVAGAATTSTDIAHFSNSNGVQKVVIGLDGEGDGQITLIDAGNNTDVLFTAGGASYINTGGNFGIGTSSPSYSLDVDEVGTNSTGTFLLTGGNSASNDYTQTALLKLRGTSINPNQPAHNANSSVAEIRLNHTDLAGSASSGNITFYTNPSNNVNGSLAERMRIDSSGNLLVGKTSTTFSAVGVENRADGRITSTRSGNTNLLLNRLSSDGDIVQFYKDGTQVGSIGTVSAGISIGSGDTGLFFESISNEIRPFNTTTNASIDAAIDLGNSSKRFKDLYLSGNATHGTTPSSSAAGVFTEAVGRTTYSRGSGTGGFSNLLFINGNGTVGTITTSGSTTTYNTSSDYRLKENVVAMSGATERLKQLKPSRFNFIADANTTVDGFLAHEVQDIVPEAISGTKDAVDADGNPEYQGIDQSKLVPLLVATIQELEARITQLES